MNIFKVCLLPHLFLYQNVHNKLLDCALIITVNPLLTTGALVLYLKFQIFSSGYKNGEKQFFFVSSNFKAELFFIWQHFRSSSFYSKSTAVNLNSPVDWDVLFRMWKWSLSTFLFISSLKPFQTIFCNWHCQDCTSDSNYADDFVGRNLLQNLGVGVKDNTKSGSKWKDEEVWIALV